MSGTAFRGVSSSADTRFTDKEKKLLKTMKFPKEYEEKVELKRVKWEVMKTWVATRVTELLGVEDEVLIGYIYEQIEGKQTIDPRILQINLTGFLEKNTSLFVKELWTLLASASQTESGIPQKLLDDKAEELRKKKEMQDKINDRLAKDREKRDAERREQSRREEEERKARQQEREKEREAMRENERKARERERAEREKDRAEREKRREAERQKERALEAERLKEREARRAAERARDRDRDRRHSLERGRRDDRKPETRAGHRHRSPSASALLPTENGQKRNREGVPGKPENGSVDPALPEAKKAKKEKKEKKEKKGKKEKKEKKDKREKKDKKEKHSPSGSAGSPAGSEGGDLDRKKSLEDDLRQKALLAVKKD